MPMRTPLYFGEEYSEETENPTINRPLAAPAAIAAPRQVVSRFLGRTKAQNINDDGIIA